MLSMLAMFSCQLNVHANWACILAALSGSVYGTEGRKSWESSRVGLISVEGESHLSLAVRAFAFQTLVLIESLSAQRGASENRIGQRVSSYCTDVLLMVSLTTRELDSSPATGNRL